jgi:hypothetical protein
MIMSEVEYEKRLERELNMLDDRCLISRAIWFLMGILSWPIAESTVNYLVSLYVGVQYV